MKDCLLPTRFGVAVRCKHLTEDKKCRGTKEDREKCRKRRKNRSYYETHILKGYSEEDWEKFKKEQQERKDKGIRYGCPGL